MSHCEASDIQEIVGRLGSEAEVFADQTVLICGGAGFLGRYFMAVFRALNEQALRKAPCRVIVLDNLITAGQFGSERQEGVHFMAHDIVRPFESHERVDYIIQAAGIASPYYYRKYPLETLEVATLGTKNMLSLARQQPVKGFLFFSSSEIYGDPDARHVPTAESYRGNLSCLGPRACYDESKRLGETLCMVFHEQFGVPTRMVRPFNVYGPGMQEQDYRVLPNFASRILGGKPLHLYGRGTQTRTFCYVTDALTGFLQVLLKGGPGQVYNIGNPAPEVSMLDLARHLEQVVGRRLDVELIEYPDTYPADEPQRRCPDISKAALQVGYRPLVDLPDGLSRFMRWARQHYKGIQF